MSGQKRSERRPHEPHRILHMVPNLDLRGGGALVLRHATSTDPEHFTHCVCSVRRHDVMADQFKSAGIETHCLDLRSKADHPFAMRRLLRFARRRCFDLIHTNNTRPDLRFGLFLSLARGIPVVNSLHTEQVFGRPHSWPGRLKGRAMDAIAARTIRHCVAVSGAARSGWLDRLARMGIGPDDVTVVSPGVDTRPFDLGSAEEARRRTRGNLGLQDNETALINVARLTPGKGQRALLTILPALLERFPGLRLILVGDGPDREFIEQEILRKGLSAVVRVLGMRQDVPDVLGAGDLFAFPSMSEGFGLAPLEAMAAGLAVVAYDLPALREFIDDGRTGLLVEHGSTTALAEGISQLLAEPVRCRQMGRAGRDVVRTRFSREATGAALERVYRRVIEERRGSHHRPDSLMQQAGPDAGQTNMEPSR